MKTLFIFKHILRKAPTPPRIEDTTCIQTEPRSDEMWTLDTINLLPNKIIIEDGMSLPLRRVLNPNELVLQFLQVAVYATYLIESGQNLVPQCFPSFSNFIIFVIAMISQKAFSIQSFNEIDESHPFCWSQVLAFVAPWVGATCN